MATGRLSSSSVAQPAARIDQLRRQLGALEGPGGHAGECGALLALGNPAIDGAPSSISALPKVVDAVGDVIEVMFDGGIRSGQDVLRALAYGARACLIGRSYIYGLGAGGEAGVAAAIDILARELDVSMALCGVKSVRDVDRSIIAQS